MDVIDEDVVDVVFENRGFAVVLDQCLAFSCPEVVVVKRLLYSREVATREDV